MEELEKLKKIGAREISKNTHMALNKIQYILDSNFSELKDRATTIGLIKILEREYNVDLQKWREEYNEFHNNYQESNPENLESTINLKITHQTTKQKKSKTYILASVIILVFLGVGFYVYTNFSNNTAQQPTQIEHQTIPSAEENTASNTENNTAANEANISTDSQALPTDDSFDDSASMNPQADQANNETQDSQTIQNSTNATTKKIEIIPRSNVWIGIVYLDTHRRASLLTSNAVEINLKRPQTIITGHGMLDLNNNGELTNYNQADKLFFRVDETGNFSPITLTQYNQYTKGLGW